jgi:putative membrane protein
MFYGRGLMYGGGFAGCDFLGRGYAAHGYYGGPYIFIGVALIAVILVVALIVRAAGKKKRASNEAIELLKIKFAEGQITEKEFLKKKAVLKEK